MSSPKSARKKLDGERITMDRKIFIKRYAPKIATYIFVEASRNTSSCIWYVEFEDINKYYEVKLEEDEDLLEAVQQHLDEDFGHLILDYEVYDNQFDVNLFTNYCVDDTEGEDELWEYEE